MTTTSATKPRAREDDRIDTSDDYAVCAWARYFNTSEQRVKEAVRAVGSEAGRVRDHLLRSGPSRAAGERPSGS
jgi:hypothetical protein